MIKKYTIHTETYAQSKELEADILKNTTWKELGIVSTNIPLLTAFSVCENIMLPMIYKDAVARSAAEVIVSDILKQYDIEHTIYYRPRKLSSYEVLIIKFLRAIIMCPKDVVFIMPHVMLPAEDYPRFKEFAKSLSGFNITVIEHKNFMDALIDKDYYEDIGYKEWLTRVLKT